MYVYIYGYVYVFYCLIDEFDVFVHMYIYICTVYIYVIYRNKTYHIKPSISLYNTYVYIYYTAYVH